MDDFGFGFGSMFGFMRIIIPIFFVLIIGLIALSIIRSIFQWGRNNASPVLSVPAKVVNMRHDTQDSHMHHDESWSNHTTTRYYVTFEVESGDRMELRVSGQEFGLLALHDIGRLTFQGTRYKGFERVRT